jgi:hypothetical protein
MRVHARTKRQLSRRVALSAGVPKVCLERVETRTLLSSVAGSVGYTLWDTGASIIVYADYNYNSVPDPGEDGASVDGNGTYQITGVRNTHFALRLTISQQPIGGTLTQTSPANNQPHWMNITTEGTYVRDFRVGSPSGWTSAYAEFFADVNDNGVDEGDRPVPGTVYIDLNNNVRQDEGEPFAVSGVGLNYATVSVPTGGPYFMRSTRGNVLPGQFEGFLVGGDLPFEQHKFVFSARVTRVITTPFADDNRNGKQDVNEASLSNVEVWIDRNKDNQRQAGEPVLSITAGETDHTITLDAGTYRMAFRETGKAASFRDITVSGEPSSELRVSLPIATPIPPAANTVIGIVFEDRNKNGKRDVDETGAVSQTVFADYNYNGILDVGEPSIASKPDGTYTLPVALRPFALVLKPAIGFTQTAPQNNGVHYYATNASGLFGTGSMFGVSRAITVPPIEPPVVQPLISSTVFLDANNNGRRDAGEVGVAGQTVWADYNYNGVIDVGEPSAITDANGVAQQFVSARAFAWSFKPSAAYKQLFPANGGVHYYVPSGTGVYGTGTDFAVCRA